MPLPADRFSSQRRLLGLMLASAAVPSALASRVYRVGVLSVSGWDPTGSHAPLIAELGRRGYVQGRNLVFFPRSCGQTACLDSLAAELVSLKVDVILSDGGTPSALAAKRTTSEVPIVCSGLRDPVGDGLVASLARPGGNVTGNADMGSPLMVKRMELLMEAVGRPSVVGYVGYEPHRTRRTERETVTALERLVQAQGRRLIVLWVSEKGDDLKAVFAEARAAGAGALLVNNYATIGATSVEQLAEMMLRLRIPSIMEDRRYAEGGVFATYSEPWEGVAVRTAEYLDRVLRGAHPAELPMSQGTTFDLVINLKTARALGITIPSAVLLRAAELIQ